MLLLKDIYHLATMNDAGDRLAGVDILVEGNSISRVEASIDAPHGAHVIDCSSMLVLPGLVNLHHHFYQTLQRNVPPAQTRSCSTGSRRSTRSGRACRWTPSERAQGWPAPSCS